MKEQVTVKGIIYNVEESFTVEQEETNRPHTAAAMRKNGIGRTLSLKRPMGQKFFMALETTDGRVTDVIGI